MGPTANNKVEINEVQQPGFRGGYKAYLAQPRLPFLSALRYGIGALGGLGGLATSILGGRPYGGGLGTIGGLGGVLVKYEVSW